MVMKLLDKYVISSNLLLLLLILSPAFTGFYSSNLIQYAWLSFAFVFSIFVFEYFFNKAGYEKREKAKRIYLYVMPGHLVLFTVSVFFLFNY